MLKKMMSRRLLLPVIFVASFFISSSISTSPVIASDDLMRVWTTTNLSGGSPLRVALDCTGNVYVIGSVNSSTGRIVKYSPSGQELWVRDHTGSVSGHGSFLSMAVDCSGTVIVSGAFNENGTGTDMTTIKYSSTGDKLWMRTYNGSGNQDDIAQSVALDQSGNIFISGYAAINFAADWSQQKGIVMKYDSNGNQLWSHIDDGDQYLGSRIISMAVDSLGNVLVTGWGDIDIVTHRGGHIYLTAKYDPNGTKLWSQPYSSGGDSQPQALVVDNADNIYVTGETKIIDEGYDYSSWTTIKYSPNGTELWIARHDPPGYISYTTGPSALTVTSLGDIIVTGNTTWYEPYPTQHRKIETVKYDSSGNEIWKRSYIGPNNYKAAVSSIAVDQAGNSYIAGSSSRLPDNYEESVHTLIKYDSSGNELQVIRDELKKGALLSIAVDNAGFVYVAGQHSNGEGYITTKYGTNIPIPPEIHIDNPQVNINEGQTYSTNGSFTSSTATIWTATVNYGDGTGVQPLTLNDDKTFSLSHLYKDNKPNNAPYTVTVSVINNQGVAGTGTASVTVTNLNSSVGIITAPANPVQVTTAITATANFTDPGVLDTHTAVWNWGDGSTGGTVTESEGSGNVSNSHTYTAAGVYTITLTVTDKDGAAGVDTFEYVTIYNPTPQGLFSGARIFTSPAGAYPQNPNLTGRVMFGVSVKYQDTAPTGNVSMNFTEANVDFVATAITSLVTTNGMANLRGIGTVNGTAGYTFLATGLDGSLTGGPAIRFQVKDSSNVVVYDSQSGKPDTDIPTASVTGQVVVH